MPQQSNLFPGFHGFFYRVAIPYEKGMTRRDPSPVLLIDGLYHVWYTRNPEAPHGFSGTVWHAVSRDGLQWQEEGQALGKGAPGAFDECGVFTPTLLIADGTYYLYYTAMPIGWYADVETTKGAIGLATAPSPFGPWTRFGEDPVLKTSDDPEAFDSLRVDDAVILRRMGRYWMYYKGRPWGQPWTATKMGVAFADHPTGPWRKHPGNPIVGSGHEVCVWPHGTGVGCLVSDVGPEGNTLQFSEDGLHFRKIGEAFPPRAPGPFRSDGFAEVAGAGLTWGLCIGEDEERPYLQRFDCDLRARDAGSAEKVDLQARPFRLAYVTLLDGPFKHAEGMNERYLLSLEADRLLHTFRLTAGIATTAQPYGGWEIPECGLRGHSAGHYLSGCALAYESSGNEKLREQAGKVVVGMAECQSQFRNGYLSAYPEEVIDRVISMQVGWAPWYTLHKIYAGLLDQYQLCGNQQALAVLETAIEWVDSRLRPLSDEAMQTMLKVEHGGMNELLANLYGVTGKENYLKLAIRFNHRAVLDPAIRGEDQLTGLHANTQIPKFIGLAREYELTGDDSYRKGCEYFWNVVTRERSYVIGGNSTDECFSPKESLSKSIGNKPAETCNTYNMLRLTRHLMQWDPKGEYADYYERALYNHILPQQNPENGMVLYFMPLRAGSDKLSRFGSPENHFWCCTGTGMESHSKYGDSIYFHSDRDLYVNLFMASELRWKEHGVKVLQETKYPEEQATRLTITAEKPVALAVHMRYPYWASEGVELKVNGRTQKLAPQPGRFITLDRTWKTGDMIEYSLPFRLRFESFRDDANKVAVMYGPLVMCAWTTKFNPVSAIRGDPGKVLGELKPVPGEVNTFTAPGSVFLTSFTTAEGETTFVPYYKEYRKPCAVYWDLFDEDRWATKAAGLKAEQERRRLLEARRMDGLEFFGDTEHDHPLMSEGTSSGKQAGRRWHHATLEGWFQFELKALADQPQSLLCTYWGSDRGRKFAIQVDGRTIATEDPRGGNDELFFEREYPIPADLLKGKDKLTVRFQSVSSTPVGGVFGCYLLKELSAKGGD